MQLLRKPFKKGYLYCLLHSLDQKGVSRKDIRIDEKESNFEVAEREL
jgi:hypothetical protein